jgi:glutamyl-tRNA synthetase
MKMDGTSKRKLSKRKDPELALTFYKSEGFPVQAMREYLMTVLNSNFEDWRRADPNADLESFKFSPKKLNPAGSLFDYAKLVDVSKNVISRMDAATVYALLTEWANEFDPDFGAKLSADADFATAILAIGRGGKKPRKDLATWKDAKDYMGFFYDEYLDQPVFDEKFSAATINDVLERFLTAFDIADDATVWFDKVKAITEAIGFTTDMKAYKADPSAFPGTVADVSAIIRMAVTGKTNSPDLYSVMQILGTDRTAQRIRAAADSLK